MKATEFICDFPWSDVALLLREPNDFVLSPAAQDRFSRIKIAREIESLLGEDCLASFSRQACYLSEYGHQICQCCQTDCRSFRDVAQGAWQHLGQTYAVSYRLMGNSGCFTHFCR